MDAPVSKREPSTALAIGSTQKALIGQFHVFDEVRYIGIRLCELCDPRDTLNSPTSANVNTAKRFKIDHHTRSSLDALVL